MTPSEQSYTVDELVSAVRGAIKAAEKAKAAQDAQDAALDGLRSMIGGDRLAAIHNGHKRIGELMTEKGSRS